jgi:hypothetical protein
MGSCFIICKYVFRTIDTLVESCALNMNMHSYAYSNKQIFEDMKSKYRIDHPRFKHLNHLFFKLRNLQIAMCEFGDKYDCYK